MNPDCSPGKEPPPLADAPEPPRLVAWEVTRRCNLGCLHCRASADPEDSSDPAELSTGEGRRLLGELASVGRPVVILTGGEPLLREDLLDLVRTGTGLGLRMVLATNGTLLTTERAAALREAGIRRVAVSVDSAGPERHDALRGAEGAFAAALDGIAACRSARLPFQVNTTFTRQNLGEREALLGLVARLGAAAWHVFFLVEVGRAGCLAAQQLEPDEYEDTLAWLAEARERGPVPIKVTCAPQFERVLRQRGGAPGRRREGDHFHSRRAPHSVGAGGCLAGTGFCFVSSTGIVSPCGYLPIECGDVRREGFARIWADSPVLRALRDRTRLTGRCGRCEYRAVCGGCRARAFAATGDYLAEEPCCIYLPGGA